MASIDIEQQLSKLFEQWANESLIKILPLAPSGSSRIYYRLEGASKTAIGAYNTNHEENEAFISFAQHFHAKGLAVPEIYSQDLRQNIYLQEDLGTRTLYSYLPEKGGKFSDRLLQFYKKSVEQLASLQVDGGQGLDYNKCFPRKSFDKRSMLWDINYFKYYFLKIAGVAFDEEALESDAHTLADYLLKADTTHFMFRDFQSRNIMIKDEQPIFIDFQGGRQGALQYDLASLLFQAKADIPHDIREQLLHHYLDKVSTIKEINRGDFIKYYYGYVFIRSIQVLGAYGFRGLYERKEHFLKSIPYALRNIQWLLDNDYLLVDIPEFKRVLMQLITSKQFEPFDKSASNSPLTLSINSFSYKITGVPEDASGNGGGFVFDCRFIHNPGRYQPYKKLTGRDEGVINFLQTRTKMGDYLQDIFRIVDGAVENYIERGFDHLQANFGCTGGQHRSVYAADALAKHVEEKYGIKVVLHHIEQEKKNWVN